MHHFVNPSDTYRRNVDLQRTYREAALSYLTVMTKASKEEAQAYLDKVISAGGKFEFKDPPVMALVRGTNGDRQQHTMRFSEFLKSVYEKRQMLSPSMTAYMHPDDRKSLLAVYIDANLNKRKVAKHEMFVAEMAGDVVGAKIGNSKQTTFKIKNNSLSGAHSSPYTILWNKSSHSTLTSTCRVATSYGNTNNEKFLYGNRHYWCPDIARNNIISIITHTDLDQIDQVMRKHGIVAPSTEAMYQLLHRCCDHYWRDDTEMQRLYALVDALDDVQRAAVAYVSDFYHLAQSNPGFCREFLKRLSYHPTTPLPMDEAKTWVKKMDGNLEAFIFMLCSKELDGGTLGNAWGDLGKTNPELKNVKLEDARPHHYGIVGANSKNVIETLDYYEDFIRAFWVTDNLPSSVFHAPAIIRRGAVTSDTDSTIFTVQYWTQWYRGQLDFTKESEDIASTMVYLAGQLIRHILATTSGAMGVSKQYVNKLSMKNEFYFPVFALTSRAKHYYAYRAAQEGNVFKKMKTEFKGVALRNSNVPKEITAKAHWLMCYIMDNVIAGQKLSLTKILRFVAKIEDEIQQKVFSGSFDLLTKMQIKGKEAYKNPESSNYLHYEMWEEVFATTYGHAPAPPYTAVKVPVELDRKTDVANWLNGMENQAVADKLRAWMERQNKTSFTMFMLPEPVLATSGIPKEIVSAVNIRPLISQTLESFYLILESLGYFVKNENQTRLISDERWLLASDWPLEEIGPDIKGQAKEIEVIDVDEEEDEDEGFSMSFD
ncbi:hypothetical protein LUCX_56 [Xanthomonas phage vB_XciM_LucasX]|nr:hypothetical protein LUCX_56 [Xanthomonas phage vB_XciM_LucasX]